jgi:hypothetical protein
VRFPSLGHGFIHMTGVAPAARRAMLTIAREWRALLDGGAARPCTGARRRDAAALPPTRGRRQ